MGIFIKRIFKIDKVRTFILIVIILIGLALRSVELLNHNYLFGFDHGRDYLAVKSIVVDHHLTLIGSEAGAGFAGLGGIFHGPYYYYSLAIPFIIFHGDPYGAIILMFFFGVSALLLSYFLTLKIFGRDGAILTVFLVAVSGPIVSQSRFFWNSHPSSFFIIIALYFAYLIPKRPMFYLPLALFFAGLIYGYELAISVPMVITFLIYAIFILRIKSLKVYLLACGSILFSFFPFFLFETRHNFMAIKGIFNYISGGNKGLGLENHLILAQRHFSDFWNNAKNTFLLNNDILSAFLFLLIFTFSIYFLIKIKKTGLKNYIKLLFLLIIINFIIFDFLDNTVWNYYLIDLHFVYIFLFVFVVISAFKNKKRIVLGLMLLFIIPMLFNTAKTLVGDYTYDLFDYGGTAKIIGKTDAIDYIYKDAKGKQFGLFIFSPPIYTYPYDYIIWWHGQKKYNYIPSQEKKGLFYLLIEPDGDKPWTYKGWLETVIKTGKILETKQLSNGFIIQKRFGG